MEDRLSRRVKDLEPSATIAVSKKAQEMRKQGIQVVNLSLGEPDFDTPQPIKDAAIAAIREGFTKYTDSSGTAELRQAICEKFRTENGLAYSPDQVIVSNGAKHSLFNVMLAVVDPGDEVIIPAPYWVSYPEMVKIAGGTPVFCRWTTPDFRVDLDHLAALVTPRTKLLVLNSPSNPTGVVYPPEDSEAIAEIAVRHNLLVISDEIYEHILYDGARQVSIASLGEDIRDRTIVVNGVSKTFAMTGWRIGYLAGPKAVVDAMAKIQSQTASNPVSISQKATLLALREGRQLFAGMVAEFRRRCDFLMQNLPPALEYPRPDGAFYLFFKLGAFRSRELARRLLEEKHLATVPGEDFGADDYVRISYACSMEQLQTTVERLTSFVRENPS